MNYYLLFLILIVVTYIFIERILNLKNKEKIFLNVAFLEMLVFLGIRDVTIGTDLKNYIPYFEMIKQADWNNFFILPFEKGYFILNKILGAIGGENFFLFVIAFISLYGVYFSIKRYSQNYFCSIFIFITFQFYIFLFSGLRQSIAFSIIWISIKYIKERKIIKFLLLVLLASTFHKTAIIFIPVYWIANKNITVRYFSLFLITLISIFIMKGTLVTLITRYMYKEYEVSSSTGGYTLLIILFIILLFFILIRNQKIEKYKENNIWFNMLMIAILIQSLASTQGNIARLTMYYSYSIIFLIPNILETLEDKKQKMLIEIVIYILLFVFFLVNTQIDTLYMPYKTFF